MIYKGIEIKDEIPTVKRTSVVTLFGESDSIDEIVLTQGEFSKFVDKLNSLEGKLIKNENSKVVLCVGEGTSELDWYDEDPSPTLEVLIEETIPEPEDKKLKRIAKEKQRIDKEEERSLKKTEKYKQKVIQREIEHLEKLGYTITQNTNK